MSGFAVLYPTYWLNYKIAGASTGSARTEVKIYYEIKSVRAEPVEAQLLSNPNIPA
jgi:hypothetical protein